MTHPKRPRDPNQLAKSIVDIAPGSSRTASESRGKRRRAHAETDLQAIGQRISDLGADDAGQHHRQPINPRHVAPHPQLQKGVR